MPCCNNLPSYLGFSYLGCWVSLHGCSSKAQPLLITLDEGYLLTSTPSGLDQGIAPLVPPEPTQPPLLGGGVAPPPARGSWPRAWGRSSQPFLRHHSLALSAAAPDLGCGVTLLCNQRWKSSIQSTKTRPGADCGSDHELSLLPNSD